MVLLDKIKARKRGQEKRRLLSLKQRHQYSQIIQEKALTWMKGKQKVALYISTGCEVETNLLLKQKGISLYVPKVEKGTLCFYPYDSNLVQKGLFGVLEPTGGSSLAIQEMDLILVPVCAFDRKGNRCGYGKGYYDTVLKDATLKIGLAFQEQEVDQIESESHDVPLDIVITESYPMG